MPAVRRSAALPDQGAEGTNAGRGRMAPSRFLLRAFVSLVLLDRFCRSPPKTRRPPQLQPLVPPQVLHFRQVPFRTRVKLPHSPHGSPS